MITKRGFLAGAASAAAVTATRLACSRIRGVSFDLVIFNERYSDARAFAAALGAHGAARLPIAGDAGILWYRTLGKRVAAGERHVAGMSTPTDLFILQTLALEEASLRLRFAVHHDCRGRNTVTHSINTDDGARHLGRVVRAACGASGGQRSADHPGMLVSWILA